jgi:hypothetical protein
MVDFNKMNTPEYKEKRERERKEAELEHQKHEKLKESHRFMINRLMLYSEDKLSDWEKTFLESINVQINRSEIYGKYLSEKQIAILERIFEGK